MSSYIMDSKLKNTIFFIHLLLCSSTLKQETESKELQYSFCEMKEVIGILHQWSSKEFKGST